MRIAMENETQLMSCESVIAQAESIFDGDEQEAADEPVFFDLMRETGIDSDKLEQMAPETKLENVLSPKEYKEWKNLSVSEKKQAFKRIHNSLEYKEYAQTIMAIRESKGNQNMEPGQGEVAHKSTFYQNTVQSQPEYQLGGNSGTKNSFATAVSSGKNVTKKLARNFSQYASSSSVGINGSSDNKNTERNVLKKASRTNYVAMRAIGKALAATGTPLLLMALPVFLLLIIIASFFLMQKKVSENAGIMPYYAQADYPTMPFNGNTISSDGCGITSMAMIVSLFKNETITPPMLAEMANADESYNTVNSHQAINKFAAYYELGDVEEMGGPKLNCCHGRTFDLSYIEDKIQKGCPVIVSVSGGYYNPSGGGHYLALYGAGTNGVFVYDAGSRAKYRASVEGDGSSWGIVFENAKHIWIFQPYGGAYLSGSCNEESVYLNLKQAGYSDAAASGIIGNMYQESSHGLSDLRLDAESSDGSIGLLQWTAGRRHSLETLGKNRNKNWSELAVQLEYLFQELNSCSQWKWTSYAAEHYPEYDNITLEEYKQLSDPQLAAEIFQAKFVRPNFEKSNLAYRKAKAQEVYDKYISLQ